MKLNQIIGDRYRIIEPIGEGGMANVYRAYDLILQRDVTVKILRFDLRDKVDIRRRFENEIAATAELNNPHIVQIYDFGEEDEDHYLVSEFVDGMDLKHYIETHKPIPLTRVVEIMENIASGVVEAHAHGIIHRDLKPQNVLISKEGQAKITDFGIAQVETSLGLTQTNTAIGSVHYMSPEQVKGRPATVRSDIYALGIMLYELLIGRVPFDGETPVAVAVQHTQNPIPLVREVDPRIPQALENVIIKATAKNPDQRYYTVAEMARDLSTTLSAARINEPRLYLSDADLMDSATKVLPLQEVQKLTSNENQIPDRVKHNVKKAQTPATGKKNNKKKKRSPWLIPVVLIGILVLIFGGLWAYGAATPNEVTISNFHKESVKAAETTLKQDGLKVGKVSHTSSNVKDGCVISTSPKAGTKVRSGSTVNLVVSSGLKKERFGDYINEKYTKVAKQLRAKGYTVKKKNAYSSSLPAGYIERQSIAAEKRVTPNKTTVTFYVASNEEEDSHVMPKLVGKTIADVQAWVANDNMRMTYSYVPSDEPSGQVIAQSVPAGTQIARGTTVAFTISSGSQAGAKKSDSDDAAASTSSADAKTTANSKDSTSVASSSAVKDGNANTQTPTQDNGDDTDNTETGQ